MPRLIITVIFWLQWTLITSFCLALVIPMWKSIGPWSVVAYWFLLGFSQALVLLQLIPWAFESWFLATSFVGIGLLVLLVLFVFLFFIVVISTSDIGLAPGLGMAGAAYLVLNYTLLWLPLIAAGGGALLGWAQWRVLRHYVTRVGWWMWVSASVVSWVFGSFLLLLLGFSVKTQLNKLGWDSTSSMVGLASVGAIGGAIKGGLLAWSLHRSGSRVG